MYTLQSLHGHLSCFHFLISCRKNCSVAQSLISKRTKFQILGPWYDNVSVPYNTLFTLHEQKITSWRRLYGTLASLNNLHIIFAAIWCLILYILRASFWVTRWSIVNKKPVETWTKCGAPSWSLFILLFSVWLWNIQIKRQYVDWEEKKAFIIVLSLSLVICFAIQAKASNLLLAFL